MKDALDVHRSLLAREIPHEIVRLPRLVLTADEIPDAMGLTRESCVSTRLYHADDELVAVVVRAGELPHPGAVLHALGASALRTARPEVVNETTDFAASLVCPVLLPATVRVVADACVGHRDVVYTATGDGGTALGIASRWLLTASGALAAELCGPLDAATRGVAPELDDTIDVEMRRLSERQAGWR